MHCLFSGPQWFSQRFSLALAASVWGDSQGSSSIFHPKVIQFDLHFVFLFLWCFTDWDRKPQSFCIFTTFEIWVKICFQQNWFNPLCLVSHKKDIGKQCRPRSDAASCGVWPGSTLFVLKYRIFINMIIIKNNQTYLLLGMDPTKT